MMLEEIDLSYQESSEESLEEISNEVPPDFNQN